MVKPFGNPFTITWIILAAIAATSCATRAPQHPPPFPSAIGAGGARSAPSSTAEIPKDLPREPSLDECLRFAALHNPELRAAYDTWIAAVERIPQARSLPNPQISYGYYFESVETFSGPQRQRLRGSQMFPWLEKLALRGDVAALAARSAEERFVARKLALFEEVTHAYAEYYHLERAIEVTTQSVTLLRDWEALIRARYRVAAGTYPDLLNAQVELGKLDDRRRSLEDLRAPTRARLNRALGRPVTSEILPPRTLPTAAPIPAEATALADLRRNNPQLASLEASVSENEQRVALAEREYLPDITLGIEWIDTDARAGQDIPENGKDPVVGIIALDLPVWWHKYSAGVREARANQRSAERHRDDLERDLAGEMVLALYRLRDADRKIDLFGNALLPKAKDALAATSAAYEASRASFVDLLEAQRRFLEFGLSFERARADRLQSYASVQRLIGQDPSIQPETEILP